MGRLTARSSSNYLRSLIGILALVVAEGASAQVPAGAADTIAAAATSAGPTDPGHYLAIVGNCSSCHTAAGGKPFAGGVAFQTDFGTIYSSNITADPQFGIGKWTQQDFVNAMRRGVRPDGQHLYPAFPYPAFTKVSDSDLGKLWRYLRTLAPVNQQPPANALRFPFSQRSLMALWKAFFFDEGPMASDAGKSAEWNRGAYLIEGLGHCGACHTPRNMLGAEKKDLALTGGAYSDAVQPGLVRPWSTANLTSAKDGLAAWSVEDVVSYLKTGHSSRGGTFGPMNEVIGNSTQHFTDADLRAIAGYLKALPPRTGDTGTASSKDVAAGEVAYTVHCGTCHLPTGLGDPKQGPPLVGSAVVQSPNPATLINVILYGAQVPKPAPPHAWENMKAFANDLNDEEVAGIATYVRGTWGNLGSAVTEDQVSRQR